MNSEEWLKDKLDAYGKDPIASLHDMLFNANEVLYMALNFDSPHTAKGIIKSAYENNASRVVRRCFLMSHTRQLGDIFLRVWRIYEK
jgi:uncharacterized protein YpiB (UPF0302 family)